MPGQDIISLGVDVTSFDTQKQKVLQDFINLFNQLERFDGRTFNPIIGGDLAAFALSIKDTNALLATMNTNITTLNASMGRLGTTTSSTTSATNASTNANAANSASLINVAKKELAAAEAATRLAAAVSRSSAAQLNEANVLNRVAQASLAASNSRNRATLQAQASVTATNVLVAAERRQLDAEAQMRASASQTAASQRLLGASYGSTAAQLASAQRGISRSNVASEAAVAQMANAGAASTTALVNAERAGLAATQTTNRLAAAAQRGFSVLTKIAYILPGLGIAGIFTLAADAIGSALSSLDLFTSKETKLVELQTKMNSALSEELGVLKSIKDQREKIYDIVNVASSRNTESLIGTQVAGGLNPVSASGLNASNAQTRLEEAAKKLGFDYAAFPGEFKKLLDKEVKNQEDLGQKVIAGRMALAKTKDLGFAQKYIAPLFNTGDPLAIFDATAAQSNRDFSKIKLEENLLSLEIQKAKNSEKIKDLEQFDLASKELEKAKASNSKLLDDEDRKARIESAKNEISVQKEKNQNILNDEINSYNKKKKALKDLYTEEDRLSLLEKNNVTQDPSKSGTAEFKVAVSKYNTDLQKNKIDFIEKDIKLDESYRQRQLSATLAIQTSEVNAEAIKNEKIANNENDSLEDRLVAYSKYITLVQKMQDMQAERDVKQRSLEAKGEIPLLEIKRIEAESLEQKMNQQADVQAKVYDIVYTYSQRKLKLIQDENAKEDGENKAQYTKDLKDLNESFDKKNIGYVKYKRERIRIDKKYAVEVLEGAISDDKSDLSKIDNFLYEQRNLESKSQKKITSTKKELDSDPKNLQKKRDYDTAIGEQESLSRIILDAEKLQAIEKKKLRDDELRLQQRNYDEEINRETEKQKRRSDLLRAASEIEQSVYNAVKTIKDREFEEESRRVDERRRLVEEQYGFQINAIEKSSLKEKDKVALGIQLEQQKYEMNKNADAEQRKLDVEKAIFDRDLAITHIILSTAAAVASLLATPPLAIAAGVAGLAQLAVASTVDIPSYSEGTDNHPGGYARFGEDGPEWVKEPYKKPVLVMNETISYLPKGSKVIPIEDRMQQSEVSDNGWGQTIWLAKQIEKSNKKEVKNIFSPVINVHTGFDNYKNNKIHGS